MLPKGSDEAVSRRWQSSRGRWRRRVTNEQRKIRGKEEPVRLHRVFFARRCERRPVVGRRVASARFEEHTPKSFDSRTWQKTICARAAAVADSRRAFSFSLVGRRRRRKAGPATRRDVRSSLSCAGWIYTHELPNGVLWLFSAHSLHASGSAAGALARVARGQLPDAVTTKAATVGLSPRPGGGLSILRTTSKPSNDASRTRRALPLSRRGGGERMKNCEPLVLGPALTMDSTPGPAAHSFSSGKPRRGTCARRWSTRRCRSRARSRPPGS